MIIVYIIILLILIYITGYTKAVKDTVADHYDRSIFKHNDKYNDTYWSKRLSANNKYKNNNEGDGPAFPGSTTIFVAWTDAWHKYQLYFNFSNTIMTFLIPFMFDDVVLELSILLITQSGYRVVFEYYYNNLLIHKK